MLEGLDELEGYESHPYGASIALSRNLVESSGSCLLSNNSMPSSTMATEPPIIGASHPLTRWHVYWHTRQTMENIAYERGRPIRPPKDQVERGSSISPAPSSLEDRLNDMTLMEDGSVPLTSYMSDIASDPGITCARCGRRRLQDEPPPEQGTDAVQIGFLRLDDLDDEYDPGPAGLDAANWKTCFPVDFPAFGIDGNKDEIGAFLANRDLLNPYPRWPLTRSYELIVLPADEENSLRARVPCLTCADFTRSFLDAIEDAKDAYSIHGWENGSATDDDESSSSSDTDPDPGDDEDEDDSGSDTYEPLFGSSTDDEGGPAADGQSEAGSSCNPDEQVWDCETRDTDSF